VKWDIEMDFTSKLKGQITQSLIECLLVDAGLQVVPLGIEQVIREVKSLSKERYLAAGISPALRRLPDFFIANADMSQTWLLEVKYRRQWNEETRAALFNSLRAQVKMWQPLYLAVFLGETDHNPNWPNSYLRMLRLVIHEDTVCHQRAEYVDEETDEVIPASCLPAEEMHWFDMDLIQRVFPGLSGQFTNNTLFKATALVRRLAELDLIDVA
jgi:hypothetical protein